jgi:hypothetical protein
MPVCTFCWAKGLLPDFHASSAGHAGLTRVQKPWVLGSVSWNDLLVKRAVIWLAQQLSKSILKLTDRDFAENSLQVGIFFTRSLWIYALAEVPDCN